MSLPNGLENLIDIGIYCYSADRNGNIELNFKVEEPGNYKLVITEKEIKRMKSTSDMMKIAEQLGV